jgi:hypothetical protein
LYIANPRPTRTFRAFARAARSSGCNGGLGKSLPVESGTWRVTGLTIDQTAIDLAIKHTSVVTYRQRAYDKLDISRQNELVALSTTCACKARPQSARPDAVRIGVRA